MTLLVIEVGLPFALIGWLIACPPSPRLELAALVAATAALLAALTLAGLWLMPPWWTPYVYWMLFAVGLRRALRRVGASWMPASGPRWFMTTALACCAAYAGYVAAQAAAGRNPPSGPLVDLAFPLAPGRYYVANGGSTLAVSSHAETLDLSIPRHRIWTGQSYGVDFVRIDAMGLQSNGFRPRDPAAYQIFGVSVLAPCDGRVIEAIDGRRDMPVPVPDRAHMTGNYVVLRCSTYDVLLAHFRQGSVRVRRGSQVQAGEPLGAVGNSGNTEVPHLHIHAQTPGTRRHPFSGRPMPMRFDGRFLVRGDRITIPG